LRILPRFVYRAPLLPVGGKLTGALADRALAMANVQPAARARYERRASFRATPHGLWAGVGVGAIGERTRAKTGPMRAVETVPYERLWRWARAHIDPDTARLRAAPSLVRDEMTAMWIAFGDESEAVQRVAEIDDVLAGVLDEARDWVAWRALDVDDEYLMMLVDDGLLVHDGAPPLVGPAPLAWMAERHPEWCEMPADEPRHAVLVHEGEVTLSRAAVERAAALAPLLFRVQEGLAPPVRERALDAGARAALDATAELFGEGAYDLDALALGRYGTPLDVEAEAAARAQHAPVVRVIVDAIVRALAAGADEAVLDPVALEAAAPAVATPPTFELMLAPCKERRGAPAGDGWLVGLHAPAGSSWGRFLHAVGAPLADAMAPLAALPGAVDVDFAPSLRLADLCAHPPLRGATIALSTWSEAPATLTPPDLAVADEALQTKAGAAVVPSPLWRVRSATAPRGLARLLTGWSLTRQHAPWAVTLGALADLAYVPRLVVDGFVVAPASWRVLPLADRRALGRWRREAKLPDAVQVGEGDELLLVDLDARDALDDLRGAPRAYEVWPPLDRLVDTSDRRVEAIVAVIADDATKAASAPAPRVPPPAEREPERQWHTWKLFGAADRADRVLHGVVAPTIAEARDAGEIDGWFFLRYVDGPGRRDHLRLRVRAPSDAPFAARLWAALAPARLAGDVVAVERAEYVREVGRYGAADVEALFESDSDLVLALADEDADAIELLVASYDALAAGAGLDATARHALARRRREAYGVGKDDALADEYRARQKALRARLASPSPPFAAHTERVARGAVPPALLPALLHLAAVRLVGIDPAREAAAFYLWERTRESLARHRER
jgi:thiopeptide-type bacteriocin biosynthesis protein